MSTTQHTSKTAPERLVQVVICLSSEESRQLREYAKNDDRSVSAAGRRILAGFLSGQPELFQKAAG